MTKFNPENKDVLTYGESLGPAMKITDAEDAKQYFAAYLEWIKNHFSEATGNHTPEEVCKINLGYWAGYYDNETRQRVEKLFNCYHPVFGSIAANGSPSAEKAVSMGQQMAANSINN